MSEVMGAVFGGKVAAFIVLVVFLAIAEVHIIFAIGVYRDATQMLLKPPHRGPVLVGAVTWALATLIGGVTVAGIYWVLTRSTLRPADS